MLQGVHYTSGVVALQELSAAEWVRTAIILNGAAEITAF